MSRRSRIDEEGVSDEALLSGVVDREGVSGLTRRLGYSERQINRHLQSELGIGPLALARAQRCETARLLIESTDLAMSEVAFAAGFSSIRQFNETIQTTFAESPSRLRDRVRRQRILSNGPMTVTLRLPYRSPFNFLDLLEFLGTRAVPGIEEVVDETYRRTLRLAHGVGVVSLSQPLSARENNAVAVELRLDDLRDLTTAVARCRRLLDLDADPIAIVEMLGDDAVIGPLVTNHPGRRVPGQVDAEELAVRAVLGQQVSVAAARRLTANLVTRYGDQLDVASGSLTHLFPSSERLGTLNSLDVGMPKSRRATVLLLARALAGQTVDLHAGADRDEAARALERIPGIGPWTSAYVRMRGLSDPDAFLPSDLGVRRALEAKGLAGDPKSALMIAEAWRPWRSYALIHLWASHSL